MVFLNPDDQEDLRRQGVLRETSTFVVDGEGIAPKEYAALPPAERPGFVMLSRLLLDKGVREFSQAAAMVRRRYPDVPIKLFGPIDVSPTAVTPAAVEAWSEGAVEYGGVLSDVRPALREASVYVLPSYREGLSRSVLEAMASGRAIITTDVPGCRETVRSGAGENGLLVPARDPEALASAMVSMLESPDRTRRMGLQSRAYAEERFSSETICRQVIDIALHSGRRVSAARTSFAGRSGSARP